jgi:AcrR family transcriptional regulator
VQKDFIARWSVGDTLVEEGTLSAMDVADNLVRPRPIRRLSHDDRRRMIIETTLASLSRNGAEGTSLRSVCRTMGVAPSLMVHFFAHWEDVLLAAHGALTDHFADAMARVLQAAFPSARARMDAAIASYLSNDWNGTNSIGAWMALWQLSRRHKKLQQNFTRSLTERQELLRRALSDLAAETGAKVALDDLTDCLMLMLDGLWLEQATNPGGIQAERAEQICRQWLDRALSLAPAAPSLRPA